MDMDFERPWLAVEANILDTPRRLVQECIDNLRKLKIQQELAEYEYELRQRLLNEEWERQVELYESRVKP